MSPITMPIQIAPEPPAPARVFFIENRCLTTGRKVSSQAPLLIDESSPVIFVRNPSDDATASHLLQCLEIGNNACTPLGVGDKIVECFIVPRDVGAPSSRG